MREKILHELQKKEEDKVMLSFKTEKRYKHIFERVCKHEGHSMSSILNALLKIYVNEFFEEEFKNIRQMILEHDLLDSKYGQSDKEDDIKKLKDGMLELKHKYEKDIFSVFSLSDEHNLREGNGPLMLDIVIPNEDNIDFSRSSNRPSAVWSNIQWYTETDEERHARAEYEENRERKE